MKIEDYGIIIMSSKFGDSALVVKILSREHGVIKGFLKGQRKNTTTAQVGNFVYFTWNARLSEHLGMLTISLEKAYPLLNFSDYQKILSITSVCALIDSLLPERELYADIYDNFIEYLASMHLENWLQTYVLLELSILEKTGFGIDIERCAVSGTLDNITYISPKSGSAVSKEVGDPYRSKLFPIPPYFFKTAENQPYSMQEIIDGLEITRYFLAKHFFAENLAKIPASCIQFRNEIARITNLDEQTGQNRDYQFSGSSQ